MRVPPGEGDAWDHFFRRMHAEGLFLAGRKARPYAWCVQTSTMYGNIVLLALFLLSFTVPGMEPDAAHYFSAKGHLIMDSLLFAGCFRFQPVMIFIQCGNPWKGHRCERPSLKRFLLFRGSWSFGYFLMWFLMAVTVGQAVHLLLFRDWRDGWLWTDALGCLAACAGLAAGHAAGLKLWKKRVL